MTCQDLFFNHPNENRTGYTKCGSGETLVFIHAGGLDKEMWEPQLAHFKKEYKLLAYDIRGHGASTFNKNENFEIDDLQGILDQEGIHSFRLIGCSLGSIIALDYALHFPERIEQLVLISPGLIGLQNTDPEFLEQMNQYVNTLQKGNQAAILQELKKLNAIGQKTRNLPGEMDAYLNEKLQNYLSSPGLTRIPVLKTTTPMEGIPDLNVQTLLITGAWDHTYTLRNAQYLKQHLPNATLQTIEAAGHLPNLEQAAETNMILDQFFTQ